MLTTEVVNALDFILIQAYTLKQGECVHKKEISSYYQYSVFRLQTWAQNKLQYGVMKLNVTT